MAGLIKYHITTLILLYFTLLAVPCELLGQDMTVPVNTQFPIFFKIFPFDRNLDRFGKKINIYIIYQSNYRTSLNTRIEISNTVNANKLYSSGNIPVFIIPVDLSTESYELIIEKNGPGILYFCPLRAINIKEITKYCRKMKMISISGVPSYINDGVSVAIDRKGDKPEILINLPSAKSEGSDFSSQLLKLSTIID